MYHGATECTECTEKKRAARECAQDLFSATSLFLRASVVNLFPRLRDSACEFFMQELG
jgi:hypothetical protein